jgi:hypothetical protein
VCRGLPTTPATRLERVYDAPLPGDVPRLRTVERWLLWQLAAVRRAIAQAESGELPRGYRDDTPRYVIQWRWVKRGQPRTGVLHDADCWMAKGERLSWRQVQLEREGRRIVSCDVCEPHGTTTPRPRG